MALDEAITQAVVRGATAGASAAFLGAPVLPVVVISAGLSLVNYYFAPDPNTGIARSSLVKTSTAPARWVVGRARVPGVMVFYYESGEDLHLALAIAEGPCDGIEALWVDGRYHPLSRSANRLTSVYIDYTNRLEIYEYFSADGTGGSTLRSATSDWTTSHKLEGISWVHVHLNQSNNFWKQIPQLDFLVRGLKFQWPGQTTDTWTASAAAIRYWWLRQRRGVAAADIVDSLVQSAHTLCVEDILPATPDLDITLRLKSFTPTEIDTLGSLTLYSDSPAHGNVLSGSQDYNLAELEAIRYAGTPSARQFELEFSNLAATGIPTTQTVYIEYGYRYFALPQPSSQDLQNNGHLIASWLQSGLPVEDQFAFRDLILEREIRVFIGDTDQDWDRYLPVSGRYEANGVIFADDDAERIEAELDWVWQGHAVEVEGKYKFRPGADRASSTTIEESEMLDVERIQVAPALTERVNVLEIGLRQSRTHGWQRTSTIYEDSAAITSDGERRGRFTGERVFVNDTVAARRLATIALRRMRLMRSYACRIMPGSSMERLSLEPTERVTINNPTNGLNGVRAQLISNRINPDWSLSLTLIEDRDGIYDTASADPEPPDELPEPITPVTPVPSGITAAEETVGGSCFLRLSWDSYDGRTEVQYRTSTETPPFSILNTYGASILIPVEVGSAYLYKLRHISPQGVTSGWSTEITWSPAGDTSAPGAPSGLTLIGVVGGYQAEWDLPSEADYLHTKILDGASDSTLANSTLRGTISGTSFTRLGLGIDTLKVFVRHVDRSGNEGTATNANVTPLSNFSWKGAWEVLEDYEVGDVVSKSGSSHICIQAHTSSTTNAPDVSGGGSYWDALAAKGSTGGSGVKGDKGAGFSWEDAWEVLEDYEVGDVVSKSGSSHICIQAHTSSTTNAPDVSGGDSYWDALAAKGSTGSGVKGDKGEPSTVKGNKGAGFSWEDAWEVLEDYEVGDVVSKSGSSHICIQAHTSSTTNAPDVSGGDSYWDALAAKGSTGSGVKGDKGEPSTVKGDKGAGFSWEDAWEVLEDYEVGDVVSKSGSSHICIQAHTSSTTNAPDVSGGGSYWDALAAKGSTGGSGVKGDKGAGFSWEDAWEVLEDYEVGDVVSKSGSSHICIQAHTSSTTNAPDVSGGDSYWDALAAKGSTGSGVKGDKGEPSTVKGDKGAGFSWEDAWEVLEDYEVGDVVSKSGSSHICIQAHTSSTTNAPDVSGGDSYWDILSAKGSTGSTGATGAKGDKGNTGAKGDKGSTGATGAKGDKGSTGSTGATGAKGNKGAGFSWEDAWEVLEDYEVGDVVSKSGSSHICIQAHTSSTTNAPDVSGGDSYWDILSAKGSTGSTGATGAKGNKGAGFSWEDAWEVLEDYEVGDVVSKSGSSHICIQAHTSSTTNAPDVSGGDSYWDILSAKGSTGSTGATGAKGNKGAGFSWEDAWEVLEDYEVGDVVSKSGSSHICIQAHTSSTTNAPDVSGGDSYWDILSAKGSTGSTGATGAKGDKGEPSTVKGDKGDKGQKGQGFG